MIFILILHSTVHSTLHLHFWFFHLLRCWRGCCLFFNFNYYILLHLYLLFPYYLRLSLLVFIIFLIFINFSCLLLFIIIHSLVVRLLFFLFIVILILLSHLLVILLMSYYLLAHYIILYKWSYNNQTFGCFFWMFNSYAILKSCRVSIWSVSKYSSSSFFKS